MKNPWCKENIVHINLTDLKFKHLKKKKDIFVMLRGTVYQISVNNEKISLEPTKLLEEVQKLKHQVEELKKGNFYANQPSEQASTV